jgi:HK97 gp10 family phage protein
MDIKVNIEGLKGVEDALAQAGPKLAKRAMRKCLNAGADALVAAAKAKAPILKEGTPQRRPGELRDSIVKKVKLSPKEEAGIVVIGPEYKKADGQQSPGLYGMFVEFGSEHGPAQPYLRPGFDEANKPALDAFTNVMRTAVESLKKS